MPLRADFVLQNPGGNSRGLPIYKYIPREVTTNLDTMDNIVTTVARATITYDAMGRTIRVTNPDGSYSNSVYSDWSVNRYDEKGARTEMHSDAYGRVFRVREYGGFDGRTSQYPAQAYWVYAATMYSYDSEGNLTRVSDSLNNVTTITYDALGRKTSMNDPDMKVWSYGYDLNGNLSTQTDAKAQVLSFNYDTLNRLTGKVSGSATLTGYTFDDAAVTFAKGRLTKAAYGTDQATFAYDKLGRETSSTKTIDGVNSSVSRSYNDLNNILNLTYPDNMQVSYTYNQAGQIVTVKATPSGGTATTLVSAVTYNVNGQIKSITYGNGVVTTYTYHATNFRLTNMLTVKGTTKLQDFTYTYDVAGNILSITDAVKSVTQTFQYSHLNRLLKATGPWGTYTYAYDTIGNITSKEGVTYTYSKVNAGPHAVTSLDDGTTFTYDANGNMATMAKGTDTTTYIYDKENKLTQVKKNGNLLAEFAYDGDGGRTKKITYSTTTPGQITGTTTYVGSLQEKTSLATVDHIYLGSQLIASINNGVITYAHQDHLGSTNVITDATGAMIERLTYKPFGEVTREKFGSTQEVAWFYFTGKKLDDETGLLYYGARYYNPIIGRFITPDTIVQSPLNPQTLNRYTYCNNNPINLIDPTGHSWSWKKFWHAAVGAFVGVVTTIVLTPFIGPVAAGMVGGALGGAITGGLDGGWKGALIGAGMGAVLGGIGGYGVDKWGKGFGYGMLAIGGAVAIATGNVDSFLGGLTGGILGSMAGNAILDASKGSGKEGLSAPEYKEDELTSIFNDVKSTIGEKISSAQAIASNAVVPYEPGLIHDSIFEDIIFFFAGGGELQTGGALLKGGISLAKGLGDAGFARIGRGISLNQINKLIQTGKAPSSFLTVNAGKIVGEQTHIHFTNGAALNIDGTWKHGIKVLTNAEKGFLNKIGWTYGGGQ